MQFTKLITATATFAIIGLMAATVATAAPITEVPGTKADVRAYCVGDDRYLIDTDSYALCVSETADVICTDDGFCESTDLAFGTRESEVASY